MFTTEEVSFYSESKWIPLNKGNLKFKLLLSTGKKNVYANGNGEIEDRAIPKLIIVDQRTFLDFVRKEIRDTVSDEVHKAIWTAIKKSSEAKDQAKALIEPVRNLSLDLEDLTSQMRRISKEEQALSELKNENPFRSAKEVIETGLTKKLNLFKKQLLKEMKESFVEMKESLIDVSKLGIESPKTDIEDFSEDESDD